MSANRGKYLERQRRYNRSAKGKARCARYRDNHPERLAETRAQSNEARILIGSYYAGREGQFPYPREAVERHLYGMFFDFREKQRTEWIEWSEHLAETAGSLTPEEIAKDLSDPDTLLMGLVPMRLVPNTSADESRQ